MAKYKIKLSIASSLKNVPGIDKIPFPRLLEELQGRQYKIPPSEERVKCFFVKGKCLEVNDWVRLREFCGRGPILFSQSGNIVFSYWRLVLEGEKAVVTIMESPYAKQTELPGLDLGNLVMNRLYNTTSDSHPYFNYTIPCLQTNETLEEILERLDPYLLKFCKEKEVDPRVALVFPKLEILWKAGYAIAQEIVGRKNSYSMLTMRVRELTGLCQKKGTNPRTILDLPGYAQKMAKTMDLESAYFLRTITRCYRISEAEVKYGWEHKTAFSDIARVFDGKDIFYNHIRRFSKTPYIWWSEFVERVHKNEHHHRHTLLQIGYLVKDYFMMCSDLGIEPNLNPKDVIEEHDRIAEAYRRNGSSIDEAVAKKYISLAKRFNMEGEDFFIRSVEGFKDIVDEGTQQHNCVASYWNRVRSGKTMIFFLRRTKKPEKSYITVELGLHGNIKQALEFGNRSIQEEEAKKFLKTWKKFVVEKMKKVEE